MSKVREFKVTKLQLKNSNRMQYVTTIPYWIVLKVLQAKKGDRLLWDFRGNEVIIKKIE
jgi:hypothetical protein